MKASLYLSGASVRFGVRIRVEFRVKVLAGGKTHLNGPRMAIACMAVETRLQNGGSGTVRALRALKVGGKLVDLLLELALNVW